MKRHVVTWLDGGREAKNPPDPRYPQGVAHDISDGASAACIVELPYPAPRCGQHLVGCATCGLQVIVTAAGRPDDPKTVKVACRSH